MGLTAATRLRRRSPWLALTVLAAVAVLVLSGCGSSSKPAYCSSRTNLENSVKGLSNLNPSSGLSGLKSQLQKIQSAATALVSSAKSSFPSETSAIKSSATTLESAVKGLPSSPSTSQIAAVASDAQALVTSVTNFYNATKSKCS